MEPALPDSNRPNGPSFGRLLAGLAAALALGAGISATANGSSSSGLAGKLERALRAPGMNPAQTAAIAIDLKTGEEVFQTHRSLGLEPASNEKLLVSYAALARLGPAFRFHTDVLGSGGQAGRVWHGNLVLKGFGDPTLSSHRLKQLVKQVRAAGIRRVTGNVLGDETYFDRKRGVKGWKSDFYFNESPPLSALIVDRGVYRGHETSRPAVAAAAAFKDALKASGVKVLGRARAGVASEPAVPLARVRSASLLGIMRFMNRESDNFTAEMLLKELGALRGRGTSASGAVVVRRALEDAGIPTQGIRVVDGSGLSPLDRVSTRTLAAILQTAWDDTVIRRPLFSTLAVAGRNGTLRKRMESPPARGHVHAKTGTTDEASSLSGYVKGRYVFSIIRNGHPLATWYAKQAEDRFATVLARAK